MPWRPLKVDASKEEISGFLARFRGKPKFLIDENVDPAVTSYLRGIGYNVRAVVDIRPGMSDADVFQRARAEGRILITHNGRDFWNDREFPLEQSPGIAILQSGSIHAAIWVPWLMGRWAKRWRQTKVQFNASGEMAIKERNRRTGAGEVHRHRPTNGEFGEEWVDD